MKIHLMLGLIGVAATAATVPGQAPSVPPAINYQGLLTDAAGNPVATGTRKLEFNIYSNAVGGSAVWGPQVFPAAAVVNGSFNVILGPTDTVARALAAAFAAQPDAYLGIRIDDGAEVVPRQQMLTTPYAFVAQTAVRAVHPANIVPPGTVMAFAGSDTNLPPGWLLCDGSCRKHADYPDLFAAIGTAWGNGSEDGDPLTDFNLPDLRGMFLRGVSGARADAFRDPDLSLRTNVAHAGQGTGNVAGSVQKDEFRSHNHTGNWGGQSVIGHDAGPGVPGSPTATGYTGGNETRPANAFVHYIIKY